jgi:hypothetical protein
MYGRSTTANGEIELKLYILRLISATIVRYSLYMMNNSYRA